MQDTKDSITISSDKDYVISGKALIWIINTYGEKMPFAEIRELLKEEKKPHLDGVKCPECGGNMSEWGLINSGPLKAVCSRCMDEYHESLSQAGWEPLNELKTCLATNRKYDAVRKVKCDCPCHKGDWIIRTHFVACCHNGEVEEYRYID